MADNPFQSPDSEDRPKSSVPSMGLWFGPIAFAEIAAIVGVTMWIVPLDASEPPAIYLTLGAAGLLVVVLSVTWALIFGTPEV